MTTLQTAAQQALEACEQRLPLKGQAAIIGELNNLRDALAEPTLQTCNCRWDGEVQVQQCTLHEAHVDAIHEWAERAKTAEKKLAALAEPVAWECKAGGLRRLTQRQYDAQPDNIKRHYTRIEHCLWARNGKEPCPHVQQAEPVQEPVAGAVLGPLPEPAQPAQSAGYMPGCPIEIPETPDYYTAEQMREYAMQALAEPVEPVEPVAWMVYTEDGKSVCVTDHPADFVQWRSLPLYTTPPQRKPLSDEEKRALADKFLFYQPESYEVSGVFDLISAVEAAHGIKERT